MVFDKEIEDRPNQEPTHKAEAEIHGIKAVFKNTDLRRNTAPDHDQAVKQQKRQDTKRCFVLLLQTQRLF